MSFNSNWIVIEQYIIAIVVIFVIKNTGFQVQTILFKNTMGEV